MINYINIENFSHKSRNISKNVLNNQNASKNGMFIVDPFKNGTKYMVFNFKKLN